jgi:hypothetical protein
MGAIIFLSFLGIPLTIGGFISYQRRERVRKNWEKVTAKMLKKGTKLTKSTGGNQSSKYEIAIEYEYTFRETIYKSTFYSSVIEMMSEEDALEKAKKLPDVSLVYVNPKKPEEVHYKLSPVWFSATLFAVGIACLFSLLIVALTD